MGRFQKRTAKETNTGSAKATASKGPPQRRSRTKYSPDQVATLRKTFALHPYPSCPQLEELEGLLDISYDRLQVWFQNRRARDEEFRKRKKKKASQQDPCPNNVFLPQEEEEQEDAAAFQNHEILPGGPIRERTPAWEQQPQSSRVRPDNLACFDGPGSQHGGVPAPGCNLMLGSADEGTQARGWDGGLLLGAHPQLPGGNNVPAGACYPEEGGLWANGNVQSGEQAFQPHQQLCDAHPQLPGDSSVPVGACYPEEGGLWASGNGHLGEQAFPPCQQLAAPTDPRDLGQQWASSSSSCQFVQWADGHGGSHPGMVACWGSASSPSRCFNPRWSVAAQEHFSPFQANPWEYCEMGSSQSPFQQPPHPGLNGQYPPFPST